ELEVAREGKALEDALTRFFALHAARASLKNTVEHKDLFDSPRPQQVLRAYCRRLGPAGAAVFSLRVGGDVVACRVGFVLGKSLYLYHSGYDPRYRQYSVMTTTVPEALKLAIGHGLCTANLSFGTAVSTTRWDPEAHVFHDLLLLSPRMRGQARHRGFELVRTLRASPVAQRFAGYLTRSRRW